MVLFSTVICIILLTNHVSVDSLPVIELADITAPVDLTNLVDVLEDESGLLSFEEISDSSHNSLFKHNKTGALNFGYTHSAFWIRFKVKSLALDSLPYVILQGFANMHYIDFYQLDGDSLVKTVKTGTMRPTNSRDFPNNSFAFFADVPKNQEHTILMRFQNEASMTIRLSLFKMDDFFNHTRFLSNIFGAFIGILLILMLYNLIVYFSIKDVSYIYFSVAIVALILFFFSYSGAAYAQIWPDMSDWNTNSIALFNNFIILAFLKFTQTFLLLKRNTPLLYKIINGLIIASLINILLLPILGFFIIIQSSIFLSLIAFLTMLIAGIFSFRIGYTPAKYFLISFSAMIIQAMLLISTRLGILAPNTNSDYGFMITTFLMIVLLSQGLASRVNVLKQEKEKADIQFKASEERFRALVETTNDFIWETDHEGVYTYVSPNVKGMLEYEPEEIIGKTPFDLMPEEEAKIIKKEFSNIVNNKAPIINLVNINKKKNGELVILETSGVPFFDKNNSLKGYRGVDRNITKRKIAEEALSKSENNLRALLNATSDISFLTDVNLNIIALNDAFVKVLNKKQDEIIGKNALSFQKKSLAQERQKKIDEVIRSGKAMKWEDQSSNGIFENNVYPIFDSKGEISNLAFYIINISEKKRAEEQIRILSTSLEQSPFSIILFSKNGNIIYVNPKCCQVTGYNSDEIIGTNIKDLQPELPNNKIMFDALSGKEVKGDYQVKNKDGEYYWEAINVFPIKNEKDEITHLISINEDITSRKVLESQLIQAQKMEAIGTLAGGIAHDFNNLLTIISGYSDLVLDKIKDENIRHSISSIRYASQKAEDLTRQILAFSKKQVYQPQIIDVNNLLNNLNKILPRLIGEDIKIKIDFCEEVNKIKADPSQYEQIVLNLIVNARDAINQKTNKKSAKEITIKTENVFLDEAFVKAHIDCVPGPYVCLSVNDTGLGMPRDVQDQIFEPFFTTKEHGKGTGLGLATVFGIVKQNNGSIFLYSEPDKGSTFNIYWPVSDEELSLKQTVQIDNEQLVGDEKILFVEDNIEILNFAITSLSEFGYKVFSAVNGKDALDIINNNKIDMLITDVIMPDMNGKELSEKVSKKLPDVKVIFASGYTDDHIVQSGELAGDLNFIQKPFTVNKLLMKIREVFNR